MIDLIKKLFGRRKEHTTLILLEEGELDNLKSYSLKPYSFFVALAVINLALLILVATFFYITPIGNLIFNKDEREVRESIIEVSQRIMSLQDSLNARDQQLSDIRSVLAEGADTVFSISPVDYINEYQENEPRAQAMKPTARFQNLDANQIIYSRNIKMSPDFPAEPPISGAISRSFDYERRHLGVDIAASDGALAKVIADGVVTSATWTVNYGYVIQVHHGNGYTSTYKHLSSNYKKEGDIIFKGDILGTVGKSGVLTSGPHIHFELWREGIALDPYTYLTNLTETK